MKIYLLKNQKTLVLESDEKKILINFRKRKIFAQKLKLEIEKMR